MYLATLGYGAKETSWKNCGTYKRYDATATSATENSSPSNQSRPSDKMSSRRRSRRCSGSLAPVSTTPPRSFSMNNTGSSVAFAQEIQALARARRRRVQTAVPVGQITQNRPRFEEFELAPLPVVVVAKRGHLRKRMRIRRIARFSRAHLQSDLLGVPIHERAPRAGTSVERHRARDDARGATARGGRHLGRGARRLGRREMTRETRERRHGRGMASMDAWDARGRIAPVDVTRRPDAR